MKKIISLLLVLCMVLALCACTPTAEPEHPQQTTAPTEDAASEGDLLPELDLSSTDGDLAPDDGDTTGETAPADGGEQRQPLGSFQIAALKGPTAMGLVKLMADTESDTKPANDYTFTLAGAADEITPKLIKGELDMACVPANLASVLYNKTEGGIVVLAVNTLGVLYMVEKGETVSSLADLKGQTIVAAGKGSTPEYALRYLLAENGIDPDKDVTIDWKSEHAECVAALASDAATIALLPQPFVTVAGNQVEGLRIALDLTAEWDALENGSTLITGVIVTRPDVIEAQPEAVAQFLADYEASVAWVNSNLEEAAALIGANDIVPAPVALKALPYCNIVCLHGEELPEKLGGYLQVLFDADPAAVGGKLPEAGFYY